METFVVRVWVPGEPERVAEPELRGFVSHSATGRTQRFTGSEELLGFLSRERLHPSDREWIGLNGRGRPCRPE
jgi:hypothetical protein